MFSFVYQQYMYVCQISTTVSIDRFSLQFECRALSSGTIPVPSYKFCSYLQILLALLWTCYGQRYFLILTNYDTLLLKSYYRHYKIIIYHVQDRNIIKSRQRYMRLLQIISFSSGNLSIIKYSRSCFSIR